MTQLTQDQRTEGVVRLFLDDRLNDANKPPGLRDAIISRLVEQGDDIGQRCREQIRQLRSPSSSCIPDAYFADEEAAENELQRGAAGIRTAMAREGVLSGDPRSFEHALAKLLAPNARWSVRAEASRVPRPSTRSEVLGWSLDPIPWVESKAEWPPAGAIALAGCRQLTGADGRPVRAAEQPYPGWVLIGMIERQETVATSYPDTPARHVVIAMGLEGCEEPPPAGSVPLSSGPPNAWAGTHDPLMPSLGREDARASLSTRCGPLAAVVRYGSESRTPAGNCGTGLPPFALVPRLDVIGYLGLRPESPAIRHLLVDGTGPALVGRLWRGFLIHDGNYSPLEPAVHGADLLLRPDLYEHLEHAIGNHRLVMGVSVSHSDTGRDVDR